MADEKKTYNIFVTGGSDSVGLATVKALLKNGHKVVATATDADGALMIRRAGALPVYPNLTREGEILSVLRMANIDVIVHCAPQDFGGVPQSDFDYAGHADWLVESTNKLVQAAGKNEVEKIISVSFAYLEHLHDGLFAPMAEAETAVLDGGIDGYVIRAGYIYGGNTHGTAELGEVLKNTKAVHKGTHNASWIHEEDLASAIVALVEAESDNDTLAQIVHVADDHPQSPNDFAKALGEVLGFQTVNFASAGFMAMLRSETVRDKLLATDTAIDASSFKDTYSWSPKYPTIESGFDATTLAWRMAEATDATEFYREYEDKAGEAIAALKSGQALPEPEVDEEEAEPEAKQEAKAKPAKAEAAPASPPASDGPTPWNEDEAKREERRRKALERKKKRAEKRAGG